MSAQYEELATSFASNPDPHKSTPSLAFLCDVVSERILLGRAIRDTEKELQIATLYACTKGGKRFVFFRATYPLQGFIVSAEPIKFVTLSELGYVPEHNASVGIVNQNGRVRWSDSVGRGDGYSYWLVEPHWAETKRWITEHVPD